jgi:pilin isopeptide linkage protein
MTEDEVGKPAYLITVPDSKHIVVVYWATFEGAEGDQVTVSNKASFFYGNAVQSGGGGETSDKVVAAEASSSLFTGPFFHLKKTDQYGDVVPGVTYTLSKVTLKSDGSVDSTQAIMTQTTEEDGTAYFGHRKNDSYTPLEKDTLYCLTETSAPNGYAIDKEPYYFEFKAKGSDIVSYPSGTTLHQFISGGTYSFVNQFTPASYSVPVKKIINGKTVDSDTEFSFTLKNTSNQAVYTDESCTTEIPTDGITAKITGCGETLFDTLYFTKSGTYTFTLTENDLSADAAKKGYSKDDNVFTLTLKVSGNDDDNSLVVESAAFADTSGANGDLSKSVPTFDNECNLKGTITLKAKKVLENRTQPIQAGEFAFTVSAGGNVIAETNADGSTKLDTDGKPVKKLFYNDADGNIVCNIDINQDDIGTKTYIISEVDQGDASIKYTTDRVRVKVTIEEDGQGGVKATNYEYVNDNDTFTNSYIAKGTLDLTGTKELKQQQTNADMPLHDDEFRFEVYEGNTKVASGTNDANGKITFSTLVYFASDIGEHTYTIKEVNDNEMFVDYTKSEVTVTVNVTDQGSGKLDAQVTKVNGNAVSSAEDVENAIKFTNIYTLVVQTGVRMDFLPYVLMVVFAGGLGIVMLRRRWRRRKNRA